MKTIVLRLDNSGAYFATKGMIPWTATNLPAGSFRFREREAVYWQVTMLAYDKTAGVLEIEVVDYEAAATDFLPQLKPKGPIRQLRFRPLDGEAWKAQLAYYRAGTLEPFLLRTPPPVRNTSPADTDESPPDIQDTQGTKRTVHFTHPLLELTFVNGGVTGKAELPGLVQAITFRIPNDHLVAEFDQIKPFFVKALKRQTVQVAATLSFVQDVPKLQQVTSPQISRINADMLEIFRTRSLRQLLNGDRIKAVDKSLFTPEDLFASLEDDELGKATLPQDGQDLLAEILRLQTVRNTRQLEFLAGRLHQPGTKLRYVLSPDFGFVFLASGQEANHFILELLNSHATYVWSIPKYWQNLEDQYRAIEKEISAINTLGRSQYRRTLHFEHEFWFVIHEAAESGVTDGFPRWKNRLLEGLV